MNVQRLVKKPQVRLLAVCLALLVVAFLLWFVFGQGVGGECSGDWDCFGFGTFCVSVKGPPHRYCTKTCDEDSDCPDGFACLRQPLFDRRELSLRVKSICVP